MQVKKTSFVAAAAAPYIIPGNPQLDEHLFWNVPGQTADVKCVVQKNGQKHNNFEIVFLIIF